MEARFGIDQPPKRVAVITGASRGIGRATARSLALAGMRVFLVADGTEQELQAAAAECTAAHPEETEARYGVFDLARAEAAPAIIDAVLGTYGRVDVLVSNAGIRIRRAFSDFTPDEFDRIVAINVRAGFLLSQAALPAMREAGGGRIIFMASQLGIVADPGATLYGMTKAALIHLARSLALELAADNITVNAVSPGPIATEYYEQRLQREPELLQRRLEAIPLKRLGRAEEVAELVTFLATTSATFIHGANVVIDGGFIIR
jgi:NAD(P)-dependent dehydrogenase (short-subunit alcohol dehydrogenase family)